MTGDLCNYGEPEAYELLRDILASVSLPVRLMLGNHDRRPEFVAAFPEQPRDENGYIQSFIDTEFGRLLFLDSHEADVIGGMYGADRLTWLDKALEGAGDLPVTVFVHHPPMDCGIRHFENIGMHDDGAVMQRLGRYPAGVRHIVLAISTFRWRAPAPKASPIVPAGLRASLHHRYRGCRSPVDRRQPVTGSSASVHSACVPMMSR